MENLPNLHNSWEYSSGNASPERLGQFIEKTGQTLQSADQLLEKAEASAVLQHPSVFKKVKEAGRNFSHFVLTRILPIYMLYYGGANYMQKPDGGFTEKERAKRELATDGITAEQKTTYKLGMSEMVRRGITPLSYSKDDPLVYLRMFPNFITGRDETRTVKDPKGNDIQLKEVLKSSEDAWNLYLGLPQKNNTFGISDYKPEHGKEDKYYFKVNKFEDAFKSFLAHSYFYHFADTTDYKKALLKYVAELDTSGHKKVVDSEIGGTTQDSGFDKEAADIALMFGHYTMTIGKDAKGNYVSYYDKWDLNAFTEKYKTTALGRPFEIYDRIYYNPETGETIDILPSNNALK